MAVKLAVSFLSKKGEKWVVHAGVCNAGAGCHKPGFCVLVIPASIEVYAPVLPLVYDDMAWLLLAVHRYYGDWGGF